MKRRAGRTCIVRVVEYDGDKQGDAASGIDAAADRVTSGDLQRLTEIAGDLVDAGVMAAAWNCGARSDGHNVKPR